VTSDEVRVRDRAAWRRWLTKHHGRTGGIWLVYDKGPGRRLSYDDIVEEALCFGWVDSRPRSIDDKTAALWVAPRKPTSNWSAKNRRRVEHLMASGQMTPQGLAAVEVAKVNGHWSALDEVEQGTEPADLAEALAADPVARGHWAAFPPSTRRAILEWIGSAKRPQTRAKRIDQTVSDARRNIRANQWRQPGGST
jgi:uncharacterized protein YdeI (YjbR/CyaY-like superfamily)